MAMDNEGIVMVTYNPSTINVNDFRAVTATATDAAGNNATCEFNVFGLTGKFMIAKINFRKTTLVTSSGFSFFADFICGARVGATAGGGGGGDRPLDV